MERVPSGQEVPTEDNGGSEDTLTSSLLYIEQELRTLSFPSVVKEVSSEIDDANPELSVAKAVIVLQKLLALHRHNLRIIEEQRDSLARGKSDILLQREAQARLKEDIKSGEKELAVLEDKERQLGHKLKVLSSKLRAEQDEVRKLKTNMQYKETQRIHESKKKEKELERLKLKLGQLVSDKNRDRTVGMNMPNALLKMRTDGKRKEWVKPGSADEDMYRAIINSYEEKQKGLMVENSSLRESLAGMDRHLVCMLNEKHRFQGQSSGLEGTEQSGETSLSSGHFQMPYDIVRDGIEQNLREKCQGVKKHIEDLKKRIERLEANLIQGEDFMVSESEVRKLEHKLSDYRRIIGQQEEMLLQKSLNSKEEHLQLLSDSHLWHEQSRLEEDRQLFEQQKENFQRERQKFMDAVRQLETEKHSFEDVVATFSRDQECIMNSTQELDSFFTKLCSTPSNQGCNMSSRAGGSLPDIPSDISHFNLSKYLPPADGSSLLQDSQDVDLTHDLSMCSDGGDVLNERPSTQD